MWLLVKMKRLVVAPYYPVEFADFWLADQLNSLAAVVMDLEYLVCFFSFDGNFKDGSSKHHKMFQFRWLKNNVIEIGNMASNLSVFNHLKYHSF